MTDGFTPLREAFDNRYSSPQALSWANSRVKQALVRLRKEASKFPDRAATEDRGAVVAFMTRGTGTPPAPQPPKLGHMTDNEFTSFRKENYGY